MTNSGESERYIEEEFLEKERREKVINIIQLSAKILFILSKLGKGGAFHEGHYNQRRVKDNFIAFYTYTKDDIILLRCSDVLKNNNIISCSGISFNATISGLSTPSLRQ
jgi:hypothetical protein